MLKRIGKVAVTVLGALAVLAYFAVVGTLLVAFLWYNAFTSSGG